MSKTDLGSKDDLPGIDEEYPVTDEQIAMLHELGWTMLPKVFDRRVSESIRTRLSAGRLESTPWQEGSLRAVATSPRVAGAAVHLMKQSSAVFVQDKGFLKAAGGSQTALHQDYPYFPFDRKGAISVWIALVDITEDMGPLYYLEQSHLEGPLGYRNPDEDMRVTYPELRDLKLGAGKSLSAGDALVHWDMTLHGAATNNTEADREAWVVRFARPDVIYNGLKHQHFDAFGLVPGHRLSENSAFALVGPTGVLEEGA